MLQQIPSVYSAAPVEREKYEISRNGNYSAVLSLRAFFAKWHILAPEPGPHRELRGAFGVHGCAIRDNLDWLPSANGLLRRKERSSQ